MHLGQFDKAESSFHPGAEADCFDELLYSYVYFYSSQKKRQDGRTVLGCFCQLFYAW